MGPEQGKGNRRGVKRAAGPGRRPPVLPIWIGAILVVALAVYLVTTNRSPAPEDSPPAELAPAGAQMPAPAAATGRADTGDPEEAFALALLDDSRRAWESILEGTGSSYSPPAPVLFRGDAAGACGFTDLPRGTFYCVANRTVYLDLDHLRELRQPTGAQGDFTAAYVIAHVLGHHVQNLLGTAELARQLLEEPPGDEDVGPIGLMVELQADCYAGLWAQKTASQRDFVGQGGLEGALAAASAIGSDRVLVRPAGTVVPDPLTHGTAEQRARWFRTGLGAADIQACETFAAPEL